MPVTLITADEDKTPLEFQLVTAPTHHAALNSGTADLRELQAHAQDLTDHIGLTVPAPTIGEATEVRFTLWMRYTLNVTADIFGYEITLYKNGGTVALGSAEVFFGHNPFPHQEVWAVPCSFDDSEKSDLTFKILTIGNLWTPFTAFTAIEAATEIRVTYTPPRFLPGSEIHTIRVERSLQIAKRALTVPTATRTLSIHPRELAVRLRTRALQIKRRTER